MTVGWDSCTQFCDRAGGSDHSHFAAAPHSSVGAPAPSRTVRARAGGSGRPHLARPAVAPQLDESVRFRPEVPRPSKWEWPLPVRSCAPKFSGFACSQSHCPQKPAGAARPHTRKAGAAGKHEADTESPRNNFARRSKISKFPTTFRSAPDELWRKPAGLSAAPRPFF